jgi:hypothetical protein
MTRNDFQHDGDDTPAMIEPLPGPLDDLPTRLGSADARAMLAAAVLGLPLGQFDRRALAYVGTESAPVIAALASIIHRARLEDPR